MLTTLLNFATSNIYVVAISEAANAIDAANAFAVFESAISEAASAADTVAAKAIFKPAISEAASAADTVTAKAIFKPAISEVASAADTVSTRAIFRSSIGEAASASDTPSARAIFRPAMSEAASAVDLVSTSAIFRAALAEAAAAVDSVSAIKQLMAAVAEAAIAGDVFGSTQYALFQPSVPIALDTDYGSSAVIRTSWNQPAAVATLGAAVSFYISVGYSIVPGQAFTATFTRPDGTTFGVGSLRVLPKFADIATPIGRMIGGTYVFCFLNTGPMNQRGQWSVTVTSGEATSAPAYFTVT